ncbi:AsmA-like C-terminal region-containing protein [Ruegeria sp. PrR005]|nr:AsmA-like C-terminal region-containing protein [Ruegeria sp. PrR005]
MKDTEPKSGRKTPEKPRRSKRRVTLVWAMRGTLLLVFLAAFSALMVPGQTLQPPPWVKARVEARLNMLLGNKRVRFGDVSFVINKGWRPRLHLRDVELSDTEGRVIARLSDAEASLAMRPLLRGQVQPKRIALSGAYANLRRDAEGRFTLSLGGGQAAVEQAPTLAQVLETLDGVFLNPALQALTSIEVTSLAMEYEDLQQGRAWTLDGGQVLVTRNSDAMRMATEFSVLSGRAYASRVEANYSSTLGKPSASFGVSVTDVAASDIAAQAPALAWLQVLDAPISGSVRGGIGEDGSLSPISATLHIGAGVVQPNPNTKPIPFNTARTYFTYLPAAQKLTFAEISVDSAWGAARAEGDAYLDGLDQGRLDRLVAQFSLSGLRVNPANVFDAPLDLDRAEIDFQMRLNPFRVQVGRMNVIDDGRTLLVRSDLAADPDGWQLALDAQLDAITPAQVLGYWPERAAPKPREWVVENLRTAELSDLDLALRLRPGAPPDLYADFDFAEAEIRFAKTLPPLVNARGQASLLGGRFAVTADAGQILPEEGGAIDASGTSFIIPDIGIRKSAPGIARITAKGSVTAALSLLNRAPLSIMDKANLPVTIVEGRANLAGTLALPLRDGVKLGDMDFHLAGIIDEVRSTDLVPGTVVSAKQLELTGNQHQIALRGEGLFGTVPAHVRWRQPLAQGESARSEVSGSIELSPALVREQRLGLPDGMVTGAGSAQFTLGIGGGQPLRLEAQSDLQGVRLALPELGWVKPEAASGQLVIGATLGAGGKVDRLEIDAARLRARGTVSFREDRSFDKAQFTTFELADWLAVPVDLIGRAGRAPDIAVLGGRMDLRSATFGSTGGGQGGAVTGPALNVALDRLQVSETLALTGMRGTFTTTGGLSGNFTGRLNGSADIEGQMIARGARSGMVLRSADAGQVFRAAGIITQAHGGSFQLSLDPVGDSGNYDGQLRVRSTRIKDAPAMAALLNAMSLVGLLDEMSGQGILFGEIEGRMRLSPTTLTVLEGSAVGPSIGLSMNGVVDTERDTLDLRGAISPIYLVNGIGSVLTRKGEGLIGFNYTLTGSMDNPQVFVNPLSGLAPGFLRDVIRAPAPQVPVAPGETPAPPVEAKPRPIAPGGDR